MNCVNVSALLASFFKHRIVSVETLSVLCLLSWYQVLGSYCYVALLHIVKIKIFRSLESLETQLKKTRLVGNSMLPGKVIGLHRVFFSKLFPIGSNKVHWIRSQIVLFCES